MGKVYDILLIDNDESDIALIEAELNKQDIDVHIDIIQKKKQLIERLDNNPPDLVISDYKLPALTGTSALKIVRDQYPQLPFILVADSIGEEKAVDIMLEGASDYAMKDNLERLGAAVKRELQNYVQRLQKQQELEQAKRRQQSIIDSIDGIVWEADAQTFEFNYISSQVQNILGYSPQEWLNTPDFWQDHIHPEDRQRAVTYCHHKTQQGENHEFEYRMLDANGNYIWLRDYVTVINQNNEPNQLRGIMVDITQQKKTKKQRDRAYKIAKIGHWEIDFSKNKNGTVYWSDTTREILEVDEDFQPTVEDSISVIAPQSQELAKNAFKEAVANGSSYDHEIVIRTGKGNKRWVRNIGQAEFKNGQCIRVYGSFQDITDRKVSEKKYRDIFNLSPQPMWVYDPKTLKFLDVNRAAINHYGYSYEEFKNMTLKDIRPENDIPDLIEAVKEIRSNKNSYYEGLFRHKTKEESIIHVNIKRKTIEYEDQKAAMVLAEDVTEKLEAKRELQLSEQKFKSLVRSGASMIAVLNEEGIFTYVSENYEQITGWSSQELIGENAFGFMHPDDKDRVGTLFHKLQTKKENQHSLPFRFKHKEGHWIWKESIGSDLSHSSTLNGYVINSHDVTERRYYTALEKIERDILEESITRNSSLSNLAEKLLLKLEDLHSCMTCSIQKIVDGKLQNLAAPSLPSEYLDEIEGISIGNNICSCGTAAYLKKPVIVENIHENSRWEGYRHLGNKYDFSACWSKPIIDSNQNVIATFAIYYKTPQAPSDREKNTIDRVAHLLRLLFDSFEKEKAEKELALREQRFRSLVQDGGDLIAILDEEGYYKYIAPTNFDNYNNVPSAESIIGTSTFEYIHPEDIERVRNVFDNLSKGERFNLKPFRYHSPDGGWVWKEATVSNLLDNQAVEGYVINSRDVTERVQRKKELQENLERYEYVTKATDDVVYDWDLTEDILTWDDSFRDKFMYNIEKGTYSIDDWAQNVHPEDLPETQKSLNEILQSSKSKWEEEYRFQKMDNSYATVFERGFIIRDQSGEAIRMIGSLQDITERKEYQEELEQLSLVASKTTDVIFMTDPQERITWVNNAFEQFSGYQFDELIGKSPGNILTGPDNNQKTMRRISNAFKKQEALQTIVLNYSKTGDKYWFDLTLDPVFDNEGNCDGFIGIQKDVTDQIEHQQELRKSVERYEIVSKATSDTIWEWDLETNTIEYSQNIYNVFGYEKQLVDDIEEWWRDNIHPDDRAEVSETVEKTLRSSTERFQMEYRFRAADGTYKYIYDRAFIVEDQEGNPTRVIGAMQDVTERKKTEQSLREIYQKNRLILESTDQGIYGIDTEGCCTFINKAAANMLGYRSEECIGKNMHELIHHQHANGDLYPESECPIFISKNKHEGCRVMDEVFWRADGSCFNVEYTSNPMIREDEIKGAVVAFSDITEWKQQEKELQESLKEKETLLMEIHHRVKNNLAVVSGMMQLQAFSEEDESLKDKLFDSVVRIKTMASIHELLYQSNSYSHLQLGQNIKKLVSNVTGAFQKDSNITLHFDLEPVAVNINQAIPCSLIVNEVVTNVYKHAFNQGQEGVLDIEIFEENNIVHIQIRDNGKGLPENFDSVSTSNSLGLQLIDTLAVQLDGEYAYESLDQGTLFTLNFEKANIKGIGNAQLD